MREGGGEEREAATNPAPAIQASCLGWGDHGVVGTRRYVSSGRRPRAMQLWGRLAIQLGDGSMVQTCGLKVTLAVTVTTGRA